LLRGGAFKPRTSPYSFQGLGKEGLEIMRTVGDELGVGIVTEALRIEEVELVATYADMIQIGARNMDNTALLQRAAATGKPILLKRGLTSTVDELLRAADGILAQGNDSVVLCERGSRTFEPSTRNSLDIAAIPELQLRSELPVLIDPSHGTGRSDLVTPTGVAGVAAGADALMVEVHPNPTKAFSDGDQSLSTEAFPSFMQRIGAMAVAMGRTI
jgi:3-deoxy-7-phosphoheptulonate synthase